MSIRLIAGVFALWLYLVSPAKIFGQYRFFAGGGSGSAILSNDAGSRISGEAGAIAAYKQKMGLLVHAFGGWHVHEYLSIQAAWNWNRNDLTFVGTTTSGGAYEQQRSSSQQNAGVDAVLYFRNRRSLVRPFLTTGLNVMRLESSAVSVSARRLNIDLPPARFTAVQPGLRVAAGADFLLPRGWGVRYAFNEILQRNAISRQLQPQGSGPLMNFQHLFGVIRYF